MRPQSIYSAILVSSFMCSAASLQAADVFIPYGWSRAYCEDQEYLKSLNQTFPIYWALAQVENNGYHITATRASSMMSTESGDKGFDAQGTISVSYKVKTNRQQQPGQRATITVNNVANTGGSCDIFGTYASGTARANVELSSEIYFYRVPYSFEIADGPKSRRKIYHLDGSWATESDGTYSKVVSLKSLELTAYASMRNGLAVPASPVNKAMNVGNSSAQASVKMYPTTLSFESESGGVLGIAPSYYDTVTIDVFSANNVPLDSWDVELDSAGVAFLPFSQFPDGTYHLYISARSSLRKKITVEYSRVLGVTGLDYTVKFGDLNRDNYVSAEEVAFVQSMVGTDLRTVPSTYPNVQGPYFARQCDFNRDRLVNSVDYGLALQNLGQFGQ